MNLNLQFEQFRNSNKILDKLKAIKILESQPILKIQNQTLQWFRDCDSIEVRTKLIPLLTVESKTKIFSESNESKVKDQWAFINSIEQQNLKEIIIDFLIIQHYLGGFRNSGILWIIKNYMLSEKCGLLEARNIIEKFWVDHRNVLKK